MSYGNMRIFIRIRIRILHVVQCTDPQSADPHYTRSQREYSLHFVVRLRCRCDQILLRRSMTEEASQIRHITSECGLDPLDMVEPRLTKLLTASTTSPLTL